MKLLRFVLLAVIAVALVEVVVGVVSGATGLLEKAVIVVFGMLLLVAASRVRHLGAPKLH